MHKVDNDDLHELDVRRNFSEHYRRLGSKAFKAKRYELAKERYTKAIKCNPTNSILFSNRAVTHIKLKLYNYAISDVTEALEHNPLNTKAYLHLIKTYIFLGKYVQANDVLNHVYSQNLEHDQLAKLSQDITLLQKEVGTVRINILQVLPVEVVDYIVQYLDVNSLLACEQVCSALLEQVTQPYLWENHCRIAWYGKVKNAITKNIQKKEDTMTWKVLYFVAIVDSKRKYINNEDVYDTRWKFVSHEEGAFEGVVSFKKDYTYSSTMKGRGIMDQGTWEINDIGDIVRHGQHNFPNIQVTRQENFGWTGYHSYAMFERVDEFI